MLSATDCSTLISVMLIFVDTCDPTVLILAFKSRAFFIFLIRSHQRFIFKPSITTGRLTANNMNFQLFFTVIVFLRFFFK